MFLWKKLNLTIMKLNFYFIFGEIWDIIAFYTKSWSTKMVFQTDYMIASCLLITSGLTLTQSEKISLQKYSVDSSIFPKASFIFRCSNHSRLKIHFFFSKFFSIFSSLQVAQFSQTHVRQCLCLWFQQFSKTTLIYISSCLFEKYILLLCDFIEQRLLSGF